MDLGGNVWAQWNSARGLKNNVVVIANGKVSKKAYASNSRSAYAITQRKTSGNTAYWHYY